MKKNILQIRVHELNMKLKELTEDIFKIFYKVYNTLGYGFLEKIYENPTQ